MPDYSAKAQPYLDAIAEGVFRSREVRDWLISGTPHAASYTAASVLNEEQQQVRWKKRQTNQPFWANYWCGRDKRCSCRLAGSRSLESDAIFFYRNAAQRVMAVHIEFKHVGEPFQYGQPEGYPLRAKCFAETHHERQSVNAHNDWTTVLVCGPESLHDPQSNYFDRVISHSEAARNLETWPTG